VQSICAARVQRPRLFLGPWFDAVSLTLKRAGEGASGEGLRTIGTVKVSAEYDYYVDALAIEGSLVHLMLRAVRDPERNRLREV